MGQRTDDAGLAGRAGRGNRNETTTRDPIAGSALDNELRNGAASRGSATRFTRGKYEVVMTEEGALPEIMSTGSYVTVWRRDSTGWKVILDTGSQDPPARAGPE